MPYIKSVAIICLNNALLASTAVSVPIVFEKNQGQADGGALYVSHGRGFDVGLHRTGWNLLTPWRKGFSTVRVTMPGCSPAGTLTGLEPFEAKTNYLIGNDRSRWRTGIGNYARVRYDRVWPGIDLIFHGTDRQLEYDFVLAPGADPGSIRLLFEGGDGLKVDRNGDLEIQTPAGTLRQGRPKVYQKDQAGNLVEVAGRYRLRGRVARFEIAKYDHRQRLVIDPTLTFATYLGGGLTENSGQLALDPAGNIYVVGNTFSTNFPTSKTPYRAAASGGADVYVTKFSSNGALIYSTYVGGSDGEIGLGIAADAAGNAYVTGFTSSTNFPTVNAYQASNHGGSTGVDSFVFKLNPAGSDLVYSTYLGGNDDDLGFAIAVDSAGSAYVTGASLSLNFPVTPNAFQSFTPGFATYVTKLAPTGSTLLYSTLVGGEDSDIPSGIAVDSVGNAYVTGDTASHTFPTTPAAYQRTNNGGTTLATDAYVFKLNPSGTGLIYSTFLGGAGDELGSAIAIDSSGAAYITGRTASSNFPVTPGVIQSALSGPTDAFVAKLDPSGSTLVFSTYFGGTRSDAGMAIALDSFSNIYVTGSTSSTNLNMVAPSQASNGGGSDGFVLKLNPTATAVLQSSYFGGAGDEFPSGGALDSSGSFYVHGGSNSMAGISTSGAFQTAYGGGNSDSFVAKFNFAIDLNSLTVAPAALTFPVNVGDPSPKQQLTIAGFAGSKAAWSIDVATASGGGWLSVNPRNGTGPGVVDVTVNPSGLPTGSYSGTITLTNLSSSTNSRIVIPVNFTLSTPAGRITQAGVVNAASFLPGPLSPGLIVTLFGSNIGPQVLVGAQLDSSGRLASALSETRVLFDGVAAPLIYVSSTQISAIVPYAVAAAGTTQVQVEYKGVKSSPVTLGTAAAAPAIFTADSSGKGQGAILNQDASYNSSANPAAKGSIVVVFLTGEGQTTPAGVDGQIATNVLPKPNQPVTVQIGGLPAEIIYVGAAPQLTAGVLQLNVRIPENAPSGAAPLIVSVGAAGVSQAGVTVAVE